MKVAFVIEVFPPYAPGGSEWSAYYLAQNLTKKKMEIVVLTPNLGTQKKEECKDFKILRYPFYLKPKKESSLPGHFAYTNPLWVLWSAFFIYLYLKKENIEVIHIQGKYSIAPTVIANFFLKKPTVATIRDYMMVCNYGICLMNSLKGCNLKEYFLRDFNNYYKIYVSQKTPLNFVLNIIYALWGRASKNLLKIFTNHVTILTVMSKKQAIILKNNGVTKPMVIIPNSYVFNKQKKIYKKENIILFAGRLTFGKGIGLLLNAIPKILDSYPNYKFVFAGQGFMDIQIKELSKQYKQIIMLGQQKHEDLKNYYQKSKLTVVPSLWPEPFGRVVIESLSASTPVVVTNRGALPEIISDRKWGYVAEATEDELVKAIKKAIKNNEKLQKNISKDFSAIKKKYSDDVSDKHVDLYNSLISSNVHV